MGGIECSGPDARIRMEVPMKCPNCGAEDPTPEKSDDGTTTCPQCAHRFPIDEFAQPEKVDTAR